MVVYQPGEEKQPKATPTEGCAVGLAGCVFVGFAFIIVVIVIIVILAYW